MNILKGIYFKVRMDVVSSVESDRDIIVTNVMYFLDPESIKVFRTTSTDYKSSVTKATVDKLTAKKQVEALLGAELNFPDEYKHD